MLSFSYDCFLLVKIARKIGEGDYFSLKIIKDRDQNYFNPKCLFRSCMFPKVSFHLRGGKMACKGL